MEIQSKYTKEEIEEAFRVECPYFYELQQKVQATENGMVSVQVRKHKGKLTDYVVTVAVRNVLK
tara:strand:- start:24515 stop:24706 length:192 start_codon:yes stop_codon:yes gene_type:complete